MKKLNFKFFGVILVLALTSLILTNCSKDNPFATVTINETGSDLGGDVIGDGGSTVESYTWNNPESTVDWNMDITATSGGSFNLTINDADGNKVLNETLVAGQGDDSKSGVSASGSSGDWTITINLTDFNGDGSFSISPGN